MLKKILKKIFGRSQEEHLNDVDETIVIDSDVISTDESLSEQDDISPDNVKSDALVMKEDKEDDLDIVFDLLINHYVHEDKRSLVLVESGKKTKEEFLNEVKLYIKKVYKNLYGIDNNGIDELVGKINKFLWGYDILDELINDVTISDIRVINENNIRIKRLGKRQKANVSFKSKADYRRFVDALIIRNSINVSEINAIGKFTDKKSNDKFILRVNICSEFINSADNPYLVIRKIPKEKYTIERLVEMGMLTDELAKYLISKAKDGKGMVFTGKGASGKTTLMNALLEHIPHDNSALVIQESEELFTYEVEKGGHPDMMFQHSVHNSGEGKVKYDLKELGNNGLRTDIDYFIIGEVTGGEALYVLNACYTGHKAWISVHGMNSTEATNKVADYIKYSSDYSKEDALSMLVALDTIVYLDKFRVREVSEIKQWNAKECVLEYENVYTE